MASSADGNKLVAVVSEGGQIYTSTDSGITWTPRESNRRWYGVASSADGNKLVAVVNNGQIYTSSRNMLPSGSALAGDASSSIEIVYVGNGRFLIVTASGSFYLSAL